MVKHERTFHTCDICGIEMEKPHNGGEAGTYTLVATEDYAVAGNNLNWRELCGPCNSWLGRHISDLRETANGMRNAR